jgi:cell division septation protein DedD
MGANWDTSGFRDRPPEGADEEEPPRRRAGWLHGRRRLGVITGIVSLAIVAAFVWSGRDRPAPDGGGEPPTIHADEAPIRMPPESPGGMEIPHQDKLVYQHQPGGGENLRMERLLPPPEEPLPPPAPEPAPSNGAGQSALPPRESLIREDGRGPGLILPREEAGSLFGPAGSEPTPRPSATQGQRPTRAADASSAEDAAANAPRPLLPPSSPQAQANAARTDGKGAAPTTSATASPGPAAQPRRGDVAAYMIQLVAVGSVDQARTAWERLSSRNADILGSLSPSFVRADLGARGVIYRLRAGPIDGETRARALCAQLAGRSVDCMIVSPSG